MSRSRVTSLILLIFSLTLSTSFALKTTGFLSRASEQVIVIPVNPSPISPKDSLQMRTFGFVTVTPSPIPTSIPIPTSTFPKPGTGSSIGGTGTTPVSGDAQSLAKQILANKNIKLLNSSRKDIQAAADGKTITNSDSCGNTIKLDPALLKVILELGQKHTYEVWNIVTEHGCDQFRHPKGKAMDIGQADGKGSWQNKAFRQTAAEVLPANGELLQTGCPGTPNVTPKNKIIQGADGCNHQHISVP